MAMKTRLFIVLLSLFSSTVNASDPLASGYVTTLTYRGGYYIFQITKNGVNSCQPCPGDPGQATGANYCWISETRTAQIAMLLMARAQGLEVRGRVNGITTDCTIYQMTIQD